MDNYIKKVIYERTNCEDDCATYVKDALQNFGIEIQWTNYFDEDSYNKFVYRLLDVYRQSQYFDENENMMKVKYEFVYLIQCICGKRNFQEFMAYLTLLDDETEGWSSAKLTQYIIDNR